MLLLICKRTASPAAHDVVGAVHILVMRKLCKGPHGQLPTITTQCVLIQALPAV